MVATAALHGTMSGKPLGIASTHSSALVGLEPFPIHVEAASTRGPSFFQMVGLPDAAVREARVRVAASLARCGVSLDEYAITVNLAPAGRRKTGAALDMAIATSVLIAVGALPEAAVDGCLLLGELGLSGDLRSVRGVLPQLQGARERGLRRAIVPRDNAREAGLVTELDTFCARDIEELCAGLKGDRPLSRVPRTAYDPATAVGQHCLSDVRGQGLPKRSLEIVAAGGHNLLMVGPPGSGKTLLARLLPSVLPPLTLEEAIEVTAVHSVAGLVDAEKGMVTERPFRAPHHSVSAAGLVGGGEIPRPGEVSLALHGVLFLDELAEFSRSTLEVLRQPLEDGEVHVSRARASATFPARAVVVAATNPCPCGYWGHPTRACRCADHQRRRYLSRLSGPLLDRLDVHVHVRPVPMEALRARGPSGDSSECVRDRVVAARNVQRARHANGEVSAASNAQLSPRDLEKVARLDSKGNRALMTAVDQLGLSARAYVRVLRVARTIADLAGSERIAQEHVAEAIQGRLADHGLQATF